MVFNRDAIYIYDTCNIRLSEDALVKLEDGLRQKQDQLLTIDASHYGFFNGNGTIYRHDTVCNDIPSFVRPSPKPIIEGHRPETSEVFGRVIAADYKLTDYYHSLSKSIQLDELDTEGYINMCKDHLIPLQKRNSLYNGLAYVQVVGKLDHKGAIKKVLDKEFVTVSIGAIPNKMICSECLQDQTQKMCSHYAHKRSGIFMLAESLGYEELSFVKKPADPFGRVIVIHDGEMQEYTFEKEFETIDATVDVIDVNSFFNNINAGKKIVCVDNICTIINDDQEDDKMSKLNISLVTEFGKEKIEALQIKLADSEDNISLEKFELSDEDFKGMKHTQFAVVQKTQEGEKRRLPIHDKEHVLACSKLLADALDLTETEIELAKARIEKAAKKFGIEIVMDAQEEEGSSVEEVKDTTSSEENTDSTSLSEVTDEEEKNEEVASAEEVERLIEQLKTSISELREKFSALALNDGMDMPMQSMPEKNPVTKIFELLKWFSNDVKWASESLNNNICGYLEDCGKVALEKGLSDELQAKVADAEVQLEELKTQLTQLTDEKAELESDIELLDRQNVELNFQLRSASVDELISHKKRLGVITDSEDAVSTEKDKLFKLPFNILQDSVNEYRVLAQKINQEDVNNNTAQLETVADPTLQDSGEETQLADGQAQPKKVSDTDVRKALLSLKPNALGRIFGN